MHRSAFVAAAAALFFVLVPRPAPAATSSYDATLKGVSETYNADKFKFTGEGTMAFDDVASTATFNFTLSNQLTFSGSGTAAVTPKGRIFGLATTTSGQIQGSAIIDGKASKDRKKFTANIVAAIPNRLGNPPQGFVLSKMKVKGTLQP